MHGIFDDFSETCFMKTFNFFRIRILVGQDLVVEIFFLENKILPSV
jgi:hypothetical protein